MGAFMRYVEKRVAGVYQGWETYWTRKVCDHEDLDVASEGSWVPTFATTNGLDDEDTRVVEYRCSDCGKLFKKTERRRGYEVQMLNRLKAEMVKERARLDQSILSYSRAEESYHFEGDDFKEFSSDARMAKYERVLKENKAAMYRIFGDRK